MELKIKFTLKILIYQLSNKINKHLIIAIRCEDCFLY